MYDETSQTLRTGLGEAARASIAVSLALQFKDVGRRRHDFREVTTNSAG